MCGLPAHPKHDGLCLNHARAASFKNEPREQDLSREICSPAGNDYITQIHINHVLWKLFIALSANRISVKRATSLAYIADLLMRSQEGAKEEARHWDENRETYGTWLSLKYPPGHPNHPDSLAVEREEERGRGVVGEGGETAVVGAEIEKRN
jgi:hypothetical protein